MLEAVDIAAELSRSGAALPFLPSAVATRLLRAAGAASLLAELACGDRVATVAAGLQLQPGVGWRSLSGRLPDVLHGSDADLWLVIVRGPCTGPVLVALQRPAFEVPPTGDSTRPAVQATLAAQPVHIVDVSSAATLQQVGREADVVRCAEVLGAAENLLDPDDRLARQLLRAAWAAVEHAAAAVDGDEALTPCLVEDVLRRTACVCERVRPAPEATGLEQWWAQRASVAPRWSTGD